MLCHWLWIEIGVTKLVEYRPTTKISIWTFVTNNRRRVRIHIACAFCVGSGMCADWVRPERPERLVRLDAACASGRRFLFLIGTTVDQEGDGRIREELESLGGR